MDDTAANLEVLAGMLKDRGCNVRPVSRGKLALLAARRDLPDLILLDINMPEMHGYEVCEHLKSDDRLKGMTRRPGSSRRWSTGSSTPRPASFATSPPVTPARCISPLAPIR